MNIQVQCCGLVMMGLLLYFYLRQKTVGLYTEKFFLRTLIVSIICVAIDVLSVVAITYQHLIPEWLLETICKTYVVFIVLVEYFALTYVLADLYSEKEYWRAVRKYIILASFASIMVYILPIYYYHEKDVVYTYGASTKMAYTFTFLFIICILYHIIRYKERINPKRTNAVWLWMIAWFIAAIIQFFNNQYLLVGFACALGMMILFSVLENPESNMDRQIGCFNSHALLEYLKQCYEREDDFSVMLISLAHYQKQEESFQIDAFVKDLAHYLDNKKEIKVFKNVETELVLVFRDKDILQKMLADIQKQFLLTRNEEAKKNQELIYNPLFVILPNGRIAQSVEEILRIFYYYKQQAGSVEEMIITVDETAIKANHEKEEMELAITKAIEEDRVEVFYQPIYSTKLNRFVSAEALVRIRNHDGSILPPGKFISVAEETGLIGRLGECVFEKTCQMIQNHEIQQYGIEYIEVNLSVVQCHQKNLANTYTKILDKYQINPEMINLEITETASIQAKKILLENMMDLIEHGVTFSLDDFGNGHSNLNYLIDMPVSILKLDMSMTRAYFDKKKAKYAVEATVNMVHDMQLKVVAEGIETKEQLVAMNKIGVDYIQGYYFSKPLPTAEFLEFIKIKRNEEE